MESDEAETMTTQTARSKLMDSNFAQNNHPMVVKTMQSIRKKKTMQVSDDSSSGVRSQATSRGKKNKTGVESMECGLCYENFKMIDEVFNCTKGHVFHTHCYEDRVEDSDMEDEEG